MTTTEARASGQRAPEAGLDRRELRPGVVGAICVALVVVGYFSRDSQLGTSAVHFDDAWPLLAWKAHRWVDVQRAGSTSLGFVLVLRAWLDVVGFSHRNAQLLPLVASMLSAPAFFLVALRMRLRYPPALLGAAMLLASPTLVTFATRVKQYSFEVPLAIVVIGLAAALLRDPTSTRAWVWFVVAAVAALVFSFALVGVVVAGFVVANLALWRRNGASVLTRSPAAMCTMSVGAFVGVWYVLVVSPAQSARLREFWSGFYLSSTPSPPPWWNGTITRPSLLSHDWTIVQSLFGRAFTGPAIALIITFVVASVVVALRRPLHALLFGTPVLVAVVGSIAQVAPLGSGRVDVWLYAPMTFMIAMGVDVLLGLADDAVQSRRRADDPPTARRWKLALGGGVTLVALGCIVSIPSGDAFTDEKYDVAPLVEQLEASRSPRDLVVVALPVTFNYALAAPQPFTTKVSDRYTTHFTPRVHGVNAMNWVDYASPMAAFRARLRDARDAWLLDTPEIFNALGAAPRDELAAQGFWRLTSSRRGRTVLEHWSRIGAPQAVRSALTPVGAAGTR